MLKSISLRLFRGSGAVLLPQLLPFAPEVINFLPPPYNLILTPILMGIGKGLRDGFPKTNWIKYIPF